MNLMSLTRRVATGVLATATLLTTLSAFGTMPSASASEIIGAPEGATATLSGPMIVAGDQYIPGQRWVQYVKWGGLTVTPAYYWSFLGEQTVKIEMVLKSGDDGVWTDVHSLTYNTPIEAGKPITIPQYTYWIDGMADYADYRAVYHVNWYGEGGARLLGGGYIVKSSADDYQCVATSTPFCMVTGYGVSI
jgi:hypothetical protein